MTRTYPIPVCLKDAHMMRLQPSKALDRIMLYGFGGALPIMFFILCSGCDRDFMYSTLEFAQQHRDSAFGLESVDGGALDADNHAVLDSGSSVIVSQPDINTENEQFLLDAKAPMDSDIQTDAVTNSLNDITSDASDFEISLDESATDADGKVDGLTLLDTSMEVDSSIEVDSGVNYTCEVDLRPDLKASRKYTGPCALVHLEIPNTDSNSPSTESVNIYHYDESGTLTDKLNCYDGKQTATTTYYYDSNGRLSREEMTGFNSTSPPEIIDYSYDAEGRLEQVNKSGSVSNYQISYEYNSDGQLIKESEQKGSPGVHTETISTYMYNARGLVETINQEGEAFSIGGDSSLTGKITYTYDERDNVLEESEIIIIHQYTSTTSYSSLRQYSYVYNEDGSILNQTVMEERIIEEGSEQETSGWISETYQYDEYNNLLYSKTEFSNGTVEENTYTYDCW